MSNDLLQRRITGNIFEQRGLCHWSGYTISIRDQLIPKLSLLIRRRNLRPRPSNGRPLVTSCISDYIRLGHYRLNDDKLLIHDKRGYLTI
jgi:hypothetical protein